MNAIHALSQLSYAPGKRLPAMGSGQSGKLARAFWGVKRKSCWL